MQEGSTKVILSAILGNGFITIIKFVGWLVSMSPSMLAEAIHSLADTSNQFLVYIGVKHSLKKTSKDFPTGFGAARYVWNLVSAVVIFFIGFCVTFYHGIHSLLHPAAGGISVGWITYLVLSISFIVEYYVLVQAYKEVKRLKEDRSWIKFMKESDDPSIVAILLEDGIAVLGVSLAFLGIILGQVFQSHIFDAVTSILIAFLLGLMAVALGILNSKLLIGRKVGDTEEKEIKDFINTLPEIMDIHRFRTKLLGKDQIRLSLSVSLNVEDVWQSSSFKRLSESNDDEMLKKIVHEVLVIVGQKINKIELAIKEEFPDVVIIDLEIE